MCMRTKKIYITFDRTKVYHNIFVCNKLHFGAIITLRLLMLYINCLWQKIFRKKSYVQTDVRSVLLWIALEINGLY